jgi:hypothetical protein
MFSRGGDDKEKLFFFNLQLSKKSSLTIWWLEGTKWRAKKKEKRFSRHFPPPFRLPR